MKKILVISASLIGILLIIFLLVLPPEKSERKTELSPQAPREISLYHYFSGTLSGGIQEMVETVNSRRHDEQITAYALDHEAFKSMIHTTLASPNPPELFTYWAGARTQALVDRGQLEPIDDLWERIPLTNRFGPVIAEAASTYNGKKYLLPITQHLVVFFYNKKLFAKLHLSPPTSWPEFLDLCQTLKEHHIPAVSLGSRERWPAQFWFDYLLLRTAGPEYRKALMHGDARYTDPEVTDVYQLWGELLAKGYFNAHANDLDWSDATELVCRGEAATTLMGTWAIQLFSGERCNSEEGTDFDYFTFPIIDADVPKTALGPIDGIVLTRGSAHHEFAKTVLSYFAEPIPQQLMSAGSGGLSPSLEVPQEFYSGFKQRLFEEIKQAPSWAFNYDLATPPLVAEKGMDSFAELIAFPDQYKAILVNLQDEADRLFAESDSDRTLKKSPLP